VRGARSSNWIEHRISSPANALFHPASSLTYKDITPRRVRCGPVNRDWSEFGQRKTSRPRSKREIAWLLQSNIFGPPLLCLGVKCKRNLDWMRDAMGTAKEWLSALVWGGLWGAIMAWWTGRHQVATLPRRERVLSLALWAPMGLWFGIVTTFGWRAWHRPILFATLGLLLGTGLVSRVFRKKRPIDIRGSSS
jgi:hypothetical protein